MNKNLLIVVALLAAVAAAGYYYYQMSPTDQVPVETTQPTEQQVFTLGEQNESGQTGQMTLEPSEEGMAMVTLSMTGGTFAAPQPAHIHTGRCPEPGGVVYPLENVVDGDSVTVLDMTYQELQDALMAEEFAVNVHQSAEQASVYTACGDLY